MVERSSGRTTVDKIALVPGVIVAGILLVVLSEALHLSGALGAEETRWELMEIAALLVLVPATCLYAFHRTIRLRHEITSRKQAEVTAQKSEATSRTLREGDQRYRALFDRSLDAVYLHDFAGNFLDANDAALRMLGYERDEIPALSFADLLDESQLPTAVARLQEIMTTGSQAETTVFQLRRKDGTVVEAETLASIITMDGQPVAIQGIARDITERRRAEAALRTAYEELESRVQERTAKLEQRNAELRQEMAEREQGEAALRESEEKFRQLAENVAEVFWLLDPKDYQVLYVSPAYEELWGRTCESLYEDPRSWLADIHPADLERVSSALEKQAETGQFDEEFRITRSDGSIRWVWDRGFAIKDESGQVQRVVGLAYDITERKRAEEALQESEERYRALFARAPALLHSVDAEGRIVAVNERWLDVLGYSESEVLGRLSVEFLADDDRERARTVTIPKVRNEGSVTDVPHRFRKKNGEIVEVLASATAQYDVEGDVTGILAIFNDITERKRLEKQLQSAREEREGQVERQMLRKNPYSLTFRELTILHPLAAGRADKEIATELGISPLTVQKHVSNILGKMDASSRTEAATRALREGLLD